MQKTLSSYVLKREMKFLTVKEATTKKLNSAEKVFGFMEAEASIDRECVWVLHFNTHLELIEKELVSMGNLDAAIVHPREAFKKAILNSSSQIIVVHNHPSGDFTPSEEDRHIATRLRKAGEILDIPLVDFMVISTRGFTSFAQEGILKR